MALRAKPGLPRPFVWSSEQELLDHARALAGATAGELAACVDQPQFNEGPLAKGKTGVGALVEWYLGKPPNSSDEPDIPELGIEVKTIPLEMRGRTSKTLAPKEPTSLTMMDYVRIHQEPWADAYLRKKIARILWVPYVHDFEDKRAHRFRQPFLWTPDPEDEPRYEADYDVVRQVIAEGRAEHLSETLSAVLAARRKGTKGAKPRAQPCSPVRAPSRAWAFKTSYTGALLDQQEGKPSVSLLKLARQPTRRVARALRLQLADVRSLDDALAYVLQEFRSFEGETTAGVARRLGIPMERSKNRHSAAVRRIVGLPRNGSVVELDKLGIRLHVLDVSRATQRPWESVPFPAMVLRTFVEEEWEDSQLVEHVDRIIFVPTYSEGGRLDEEHVLGRAFKWKPAPADWGAMEREWRACQKAVAACRLDQVPRGTTRIHMRPHGRDRDDTDLDPCGNVVTKQCFWLNQDFVQGILAAGPASADGTI